MTNIKWKDIYYPIGSWYAEDGTEVSVNQGKNFPFELNGTKGICVMVNGHCDPSHGESAINSPVPMFLNAETYEAMKIDGFISVDSSIVSVVQNEKVTHKVKEGGEVEAIIENVLKRFLIGAIEDMAKQGIARLRNNNKLDGD